MTCGEEKARLRRTLSQRLSAWTPEQFLESDRQLFARFLELPQLEQTDVIFAFWGVPSREPDTARLIRALLARGKQIALPRMLPERGMEVRLYDPARPLVQAAFGIYEPDTSCPLLAPEKLSLALVPSLCYDKLGNRLGFGGGYYDRWLPQYSGLTVGLCRDAVLQEHLPTQPHDCSVQLVLTETARYGRPDRSPDSLCV